MQGCLRLHAAELELEKSSAYKHCMHNGKSLSAWQKELGYEFTLGELHRLAMSGCFPKTASHAFQLVNLDCLDCYNSTVS